MHPLTSEEGRRFVDAQVKALLDAVVEEFDTAVEEGDRPEVPSVEGLAWSHDDDSGEVDDIRIKLHDEWAELGHEALAPDEWGYELGLGVEGSVDGANLITQLDLAGVERPEEAIAAAVAEQAELAGWPGIDRTVNFTAWVRVDTRWRALVGQRPTTPTASGSTEMPHLSPWVTSADLAGRLRQHIAETAAVVRDTFEAVDHDSPICLLALVSSDEPLDHGYLFALTKACLDEADDASALMASPADWDLDPLPDDLSAAYYDEGEALSQELQGAGCTEPAELFHREVCDELRRAGLGTVFTTDDVELVAFSAD